MATSLDATARQAALDAVVDLLDSGTVEIREGSAADPDAAATGTVLATISLAATAFSAASADDDGTTATCTAQGVLEDTSADASGTAGHFVAKQSGGNVLLTGTVGQGSGDMSLNNTTITAGGTVTITSWTVTLGQAQS